MGDVTLTMLVPEHPMVAAGLRLEYIGPGSDAPPRTLARLRPRWAVVECDHPDRIHGRGWTEPGTYARGLRVARRMLGPAGPPMVPVRAVAPAPFAILNTSIVTEDGAYTLATLTLDDARKLVADADAIDSAVGHDATAAVLTELLGVPVPVNRQPFAQQLGQQALVLKMHGRPPEGVILDRAAMEEIGYSLRLLTRTA